MKPNPNRCIKQDFFLYKVNITLYLHAETHKSLVHNVDDSSA